MATLFCPSVSLVKDAKPTDTLRIPVVKASPAEDPIKVFAVHVVNSYPAL